MPAGDWIHWIAVVVVLLALVALVYLAWHSLFHDRPNGRRRCPRCWHDLSYTPGMTCGECGFTATHERQFDKTRRRYGRATMAMIGCLAIAGIVNERVARTGWISLAPTKVLILALPVSGSDGGQVYTELARRMSGGSLSEREWGMIIKRCAEGDWAARPIEQAWIDKYGVVIERWRGALVVRAEGDTGRRRLTEASSAPYSSIEEILMDIPPLLELSTPEQWPLGSRPRLQVQLRHWWPVGSEARLRITMPDKPGEEIFLHRSENPMSRAGYAVALGEFDPATERIAIDVDVQRRRSGLNEPWQDVTRQSIILPVHFTADAAEGLQPNDDRAITDAIRECFGGQVVAWPSGRAPVRFRYNPIPTYAASLDDVAVGVELRLLRGDELARQLNMWWLGGTAPSDPSLPSYQMDAQGRGLGWEVAYENAALLDEIDPDDDRWVIQVNGSRELALLAGSAKEYWSGSFVMPLEVITGRGVAPPAEWWVGDD